MQGWGEADATGEGVRLRPYRRSDLRAMVALDEVCFAPEFLFGRRTMRRFAEARGANAVVAERGEAMVGFAIGQMEREGEERVGYCVTLDVAPAERRTGLGRRLLGELERWAAGEGAGEMVLHVWVGNEGARRFYAERRYREVRQVKGFYRRGLDGLECRKEL